MPVSVGICWWEVQFHPLCGLQTLQSYNTHGFEAGFLSSPEQHLLSACRACWDETLGDLDRSEAETAGHQSHCGISSKLPIQRLQAVKVSLLLMPDCKSNAHVVGKGSSRFIFSLTVPLCWCILQFDYCSEATAERKALPGKGTSYSVQCVMGRLSVYSYLIHPFFTSYLTIWPRHAPAFVILLWRQHTEEGWSSASLAAALKEMVTYVDTKFYFLQERRRVNKKASFLFSSSWPISYHIYLLHFSKTPWE